MMQKFFTNTVHFLILALLFFSCRDGDGNPHPIPLCVVSIDIDQRGLDNDFVPGRMKTFDDRRGPAGCYGNRGGGIVVINLNDEEFFAWDMACPNNHFAGCIVVQFRLTSQEIPTYFECSLCKIRFNPLDGTPISGSRYVMRRYRATRQPNGIIEVRR